MRASPGFKTADANFDYLVKKLQQGSWDSNPTRHDFSTFVYVYPQFEPKPKQSLAQFFASRADALRAAGNEKAIERLRAHVRRYFAVALKRKDREWVSLVEKLGTPTSTRSIKYVFQSGGNYDEQKIAKLPASAQKQFLVAGSRYLGGKSRSLTALFKQLRADDDDGQVDIQHWRISIKGSSKTPVYEMWTFMVDNGTVFPFGKATPSVEMTQGTFQANKANRDLAADLQAVVPF